MTDEELIEQLGHRAPAEWTAAELAELRRLWPASAALRTAFAEHLQLESQLATHFANPQLQVAGIVERARRQRAAGRYPYWWGAIGLLLLTTVGLRVWSVWPQPAAQPLPKAQRVATGSGTPAVTTDVTAPEQTGSETNPSNLVAQTPAAGETAPALATTPETPARSESDPETTFMPAEMGPPDPTAVAVASVTNPAVPIPAGPWEAGLSPDVPAWSVSALGWTKSDLLDPQHESLSEALCRQWLAQVEGHPFELGQEVNSNRLTCRFNGRARLRAPLPEGTVLRLSAFDTQQLCLNLWTGNQGIQLRYYPHQNPQLWTAYRIERDGQRERILSLLTTDSGRYDRAAEGRFEVRYQAGSLILAKGTIPLLVVPMAAAPEEVELDGRFRLRGISLVRGDAWPVPPPTARTTIWESFQPGQLPWRFSATNPASLLTEGNDLCLTTTSAQETGLVFMPLVPAGAPPGFYEVQFQLGNSEPGMGVYLGDENGQPVQRVAIVKERRSDRPALSSWRRYDSQLEVEYDHQHRPSLLVEPGQWIKIAVGLAHWQVQISADGRHWGQLADYQMLEETPQPRTLGLFGLPGQTPRMLRIRAIRVQRHTGWDSVVSPAQLTQAPVFTTDDLRDEPLWLERVTAARPPEREPIEWSQTCALAALLQQPPENSHRWLLRPLLQTGLLRLDSIDEQLALLETLSTIGAWWDESRAHQLTELYAATGQQRQQQRQPAWGQVHRAWLENSLFGRGELTNSLVELATTDLVGLTLRHDWPPAVALAQSVRLWLFSANPDENGNEERARLDRLARWSMGLASEARAPGIPAGVVLPAEWRAPLTLGVSKEGYNLRAELSGALNSGSYDDASRILLGLRPESGPAQATWSQAWGGLLPDEQDERLSMTWPVLVNAALADHPELRTALQNRVGKIGHLRVQQAIRDSDVSAVGTVAIQFGGTTPSAVAHRWLGDRAFASGAYGQASWHYLQGLAVEREEPTLYYELLARYQMASSCMGNVASEVPHPSTAELGPAIASLGVSPQDWQELLGASQSRTIPAAKPVRRSQAEQFVPSRYEIVQRLEYDGQSGQHAGRGDFDPVDAIGQQLAIAHEGDLLVVSNRFQVNAYRWPGGQLLWSSPLGGEQGDAYAWAQEPMTPLIRGDLIYVRRLLKAGPELAALNRSDGQVAWSTEDRVIASDPIIWNHGIAAITVTTDTESGPEDQWTYHWERFDAQSGELLVSQPLLSSRVLPQTEPICRLVVQGLQGVVQLPGGVAGFFPEVGRAWVRRCDGVPQPLEAHAAHQTNTLELEETGQVLVSARGSRQIEELELRTGRRRWQYIDAEHLSVAGTSRRWVFATTTTDVTAIARQTGQVAWRVTSPQRLMALLPGEDRCLLLRQHPTSGGSATLELEWRETEAGQTVARFTLESRPHNKLRAGPWWVIGDQPGGWLSQSGDGTGRALVELRAVGGELPPLPPVPNDEWLR